MALQGTLKDFSITEIVQLIGQQLKTGVLTIRKGKKLVEIYFVDGMIVHVFSNYRGKKDLIGEILVKAKLITEEQLERVLGIQRETHKYLGEILVELQLLTKDDILKVLSTQVYETIYDLFWWDDGIFSFDLKLVESYKKIPFALSTEQVLLNILRMVDEWSEIEKRIHSPHLVFRKVALPKDKSFDPVSPLNSEQKLVYQLVDATRTVEEIMDRSLLGKFYTSEILNNLSEMGLIETVGVRTPSPIKRMSMLKVKEILNIAYYAGFFSLIFLILVYYKPNFLRHFWPPPMVASGDRAIPAHLVSKTEIKRIKNALEIYRLEKGKYPNHLEELISARLLRTDDLFYARGVSYQYLLKDGKYLLKR